MNPLIILEKTKPRRNGKDEAARNAQPSRQAENLLDCKLSFQESEKIGRQTAGNRADHVDEAYSKAVLCFWKNIDNRRQKVCTEDSLKKTIG